MKRLAKPEGFGNVIVEEVDVPEIGDGEILVRIHRSLISRGSEIGGRYRKEGAVDADRMGYSAAGTVEKVGDGIDDVAVGDRVSLIAPHGEYGVGKMEWRPGEPSYVKIPDEMSFEHATFIPLARSSVGWARSACIEEGGTVVVLGQGLVGALCLQTVREMKPSKVIAVDAIDMRCDLAKTLGADVVVNVSKQNAVKAVRDATNGRGADVVMDCVGGPAGVKSFAQAQDMVRGGGVIQVVGLYHEAPLPLEASKIQGKLIVGGM
ncbi:MAG: zinc-binding dehydrogenase, partial [Planctomycetes bacterium]|nr:zinc-binding dehydrogenase [Planctomycetota bacterium]